MQVDFTGSGQNVLCNDPTMKPFLKQDTSLAW